MAVSLPKIETKALPNGLGYYVAYPHLPRKGDPKDRYMKTIEGVVFHHWGVQMSKLTQDTLVEQWNILVNTANFHKKKSYARGIQYHWVIFLDGTVFYTREDHEWENHCSNGVLNKKSVGISYVCDTTKQGLSDAQMQAGAKIAQYYEEHKKVKRVNVGGHTEVAQKGNATSCPGTVGMQFVKNYRAGKYDKAPEAPKDFEKMYLQELENVAALTKQVEDLTSRVADLQNMLNIARKAEERLAEQIKALETQCGGDSQTAKDLKKTIEEQKDIIAAGGVKIVQLKQKVHDLENESVWVLLGRAILSLFKKDGNENKK